jgi:hypothetical protein
MKPWLYIVFYCVIAGLIAYFLGWTAMWMFWLGCTYAKLDSIASNRRLIKDLDRISAKADAALGDSGK